MAQIKPGCQRGLTLIELLIAMTIGLVLLAGVVTVMIGSKNHFYSEEEMSYIQENGRFAIDQLGYDIRMAGYFGCSVLGELTNTLEGSDAESWLSSNGIKGFEYSEKDDADFPDGLSDLVLAGTDVVVINRGEQDDSLIVTEHKPTSATIDLASGSDAIVAGDILVLVNPDCSHAAIFQMSGPNSSNPDHINHNTGNTVSPGNCRKALSDADGKAYACGDSNEPANNGVEGFEFQPGSSLMKFNSSAYFIGTSTITGLPTLYRSAVTRSGSTASSVNEELISGVENMQILYGLDTSTDMDGVVDQYVRATSITQDEASGGVYTAWDRVITVRLDLVMRSARPVYPENTEVNLGVDLDNDNAVDDDVYNDRFMRQKFSTTFRIRNRGIGL